jgi:adenine C2-methylase RlmN of 23S rRNA A2503 and tRNA A37
MKLLDKYLLLEANTVSDSEYERLTGSSLEEFRVRMKQHMAETKKRVEAEKEKKSRPDD